jgi:tRNA threonylcarbamoyladenosine biosynthesis protein TsaE
VIAGHLSQRVVVTRDAASTRALAGALAAAARPGDLISLVGDLGAGKTQFAKGFGAALGITDTIVSPSFVLMAEYRGRLPLFHVDLYRLADAAEALAGGLIDDRQVEGVTLVEWAERLADAMPDERLDVLIDGAGDEPRRITLRPGNATYARYLDAVPSGVEAADGDAADGDAAAAATAPEGGR